MVNPTFQHHAPFVIPTNITLKLAALCRLLHICHWQRSLPILPNFSNKHIVLRHKTQHLRYSHAKTCTHYLHCYLSVFYFHPPLSTPSSQYYVSWDGSDNYPISVYLGKWTVKYSLKDSPPQNKVSLSWCKLCGICSSLHYCTEGDVQSSNSKILLLTRCQRIYGGTSQKSL